MDADSTIYVIADNDEQADALTGQFAAFPCRERVKVTATAPPGRKFKDGDIVAFANLDDRYVPPGLTPTEILELLTHRAVQRSWFEVVQMSYVGTRPQVTVVCASSRVQMGPEVASPVKHLIAILADGNYPPAAWFDPAPIHLHTVAEAAKAQREDQA